MFYTFMWNVFMGFNFLNLNVTVQMLRAWNEVLGLKYWSRKSRCLLKSHNLFTARYISDLVK